MNHFATTLALAALLAAPLSAHAQASAQGQLTNFSYALTDLLPDDGIAPSLSFIPNLGDSGPGAQVGGALTQRGARWEQEDAWDRSSALFSRDLDASVGASFGNALATVTGTSLHSLAVHNAASATAQLGHTRKANTFSYMPIERFVLSPGAQVAFFADVSASASTSRPNTGLLRETATFSASLHFDGVDSRSYPDSVAEFALSGPVWHADPDLIYSESGSERLSIMYKNTGAQPINLALIVNVLAEATAIDTTPSSPVPEPATGAMLMAGLGLVATIARRRRAG